MVQVKNVFDTFTDTVLNGTNLVIEKAPIVIICLALGVLTITVVRHILRFALSLTTVQEGLREVIVSIAEIVLWVIFVVTMLPLLGLGQLVVFFTGSLAAIGLVMAAGGSTLISDIVAGIFLARDSDFAVGDEVKAGEVPTQGVIESMDARRTRIRDADGILHVIPNSVVERKEWVLIKKSEEVPAIAKAVAKAKKLRAATLDKKAQAREKESHLRDNAQ